MGAAHYGLLPRVQSVRPSPFWFAPRSVVITFQEEMSAEASRWSEGACATRADGGRSRAAGHGQPGRGTDDPAGLPRGGARGPAPLRALRPRLEQLEPDGAGARGARP